MTSGRPAGTSLRGLRLFRSIVDHRRTMCENLILYDDGRSGRKGWWWAGGLAFSPSAQDSKVKPRTIWASRHHQGCCFGGSTRLLPGVFLFGFQLSYCMEPRAFAPWVTFSCVLSVVASGRLLCVLSACHFFLCRGEVVWYAKAVWVYGAVLDGSDNGGAPFRRRAPCILAGSFRAALRV